MKRMKKKKIVVILLGLLLSFIFVTIPVIAMTTHFQEDLQEQTTREIREYYASLPVNEDGIVTDTRDNPYFATRQEGFSYWKNTTITYESGVTGTQRKANVLLPLDYDESKEYPVLYILHGMGGSHNTWLNKDADIIIQNLMYFNDVEPMIVVLPNSELNEEADTDGLDWTEIVPIYDKTREELIDYLMPYIEEHFSVKTGPENTAIAGNSLGGRETLSIAFSYPEKFGYVGAFSSSSVISDGQYPVIESVIEESDLGKVNDFKLFMLMVGRQDDVCGWVTYDLEERLNAIGANHIFYDVEGGHNTYVWQNALYNFVQRIFK